MSAEAFLQSQLVVVKTQEVENLASRIHETNDIPDPYILRLIKGKFCTLERKPVEDYIEKYSYLGSREIIAFRQIENWSQNPNAINEVALWFSPPFKNIYPTSKVTISNLSDDGDFIVNRSIKLQIEGKELLNLAQPFSENKFLTNEDLRSHAFFINKRDLLLFYDKLRAIVPEQIQLIESNSDIRIKEEIRDQVQDIRNKFPRLNNQRATTTSSLEARLYEEAKKKNLIGKSSESCPIALVNFQLFTPYQMFSEGGNSSEHLGKKIIKNCGACNKLLMMYMGKGDHCPYCNEIYEGC